MVSSNEAFINLLKNVLLLDKEDIKALQNKVEINFYGCLIQGSYDNITEHKINNNINTTCWW